MRQIKLITGTFEHNVHEKEFLSFLEPNAPNKLQCIYLSCSCFRDYGVNESSSLTSLRRLLRSVVIFPIPWRMQPIRGLKCCCLFFGIPQVVYSAVFPESSIEIVGLYLKRPVSDNLLEVTGWISLRDFNVDYCVTSYM